MSNTTNGGMSTKFLLKGKHNITYHDMKFGIYAMLIFLYFAILLTVNRAIFA